MKALIDGDIIIYSCAFVAEKKIYSVYTEQNGEVLESTFLDRKDALAYAADRKGEMVVTTSIMPVAYSLHAINSLIERIISTTNASSYEVYITGDGNFRETLVDYYKENRKDMAKPVHYEACREFLLRRHGATVIEGMEADDAMGIAQSIDYFHDSKALAEYGTIICTRDKDLDMIPGWHYNWEKDVRYFVSEDGGMEAFYAQMIKGDSTDNIPGLFKLTGVKAAKKYFDPLVKASPFEMWKYVSSLYVDRGVPIEKVVEIARLLWIKRSNDAALWEPPNDPSVHDLRLAPESQEHPQV